MFNKDMEKEMKQMMNASFKAVPIQFKILWALGATASLGMVGLCGWAIYRIVIHFTQ